MSEKSLGVSADFSEAGTLLHVDKENLFGGDQQEGGITQCPCKAMTTASQDA